MNAYIINLNRASDRWEHVQSEFLKTTFKVQRVEAVDGRELHPPIQDFNQSAFLRFHGRAVNLFEVACYLSHLKALAEFLTSGEEYGLICEDDLVLARNFENIVEEALDYSAYWDLLRLAGSLKGQSVRVSELSDGYTLNSCMCRLKGTGAYLLTKKAALRLVKALSPMFLPIDHAIDREWICGLRALYISPFPVFQQATSFESSIQKHAGNRLGYARRLLTTYPYQVVNELSRYVIRPAYGMYSKMRAKQRSK